MVRRGLVVALLAAVASVGGSSAAPGPTAVWPQYRFGPDHTGATPYEHVLGRSNVRRLRLAWSVETGGPIWSSAAVFGGVVYIGSNDRHVYALRLSDGRTLWKAPIGGRPSAPAVVGGIVYAVADDASAYAFDAATGKRLWRTNVLGVEGGFPAAATVADGTVYVQDEGVTALDAATGAIRWRRDLECFGCPVAFANGTVYAAGAEGGDVAGRFLALDRATGNPRWEAALGGGPVVTPSIGNGTAYVGAVVNPASNVRTWVISAFDTATGSPLWRTAIGRSRYLTFASTAVAGGRVVFPSPAGRLVALDAKTGQRDWTAPLKVTNSAPAIANRLVYVGSSDGRLYAFDLRTGRRLWRAVTRGDVTSSPTVAGGTVIVGSDDGGIRAFRLPR